MSDKHLKLTSHKIRGDDDAWWYEEPKGISIVVTWLGGYKTVDIPWRLIRAALARKDKKP